MFTRNLVETCPYAGECSGYVGGFLCCNGNHVNCDRFKLVKKIDGCRDEMEKVLRGLNGES